MRACPMKKRVSKRIEPVKVESASGKSALSKSALSKSAPSKSALTQSASKLIKARIEELSDWRGELLARLRALIKQADPDVVEEWKWGIPVWSQDGSTGTGET